jgi:hypothetical protein
MKNNVIRFQNGLVSFVLVKSTKEKFKLYKNKLKATSERESKTQ